MKASNAQRTSLKLNSFASTSVVHRVADELRQAILTLGEGVYLGSEDCLAVQLCVSAPTLRQATRLLEHEQLLVTRRGAAGGYYTRRPDIQAATHMAAIFLGAHNATVRDNFVICTTLSPLILELAIRSERTDLRVRLEACAAGVRPRGALPTGDDEVAFQQLLAELTGNLSLQLIMAILRDFGRVTQRSARRLDRQATARQIEVRRRLSRAILDGDLETAKTLDQERYDFLAKQWIEAAPALAR